MSNFPLTKDNWYALRDDRTKRIDGANGFENFKVGVIIDSNIEAYPTQVMAAVALNILARWCRNIKIEILGDAISLLPIYKDLKLSDALMKMISGADPYGDFSYAHVNESECDEILIIGDSERMFKNPHIWVNASGWLASISYSTRAMALSGNNHNIIGPAFASCLGVAEIFKRAIGLPPVENFSHCLSLYDLGHGSSADGLKNPQFSNQVDFGRIHQVGCGAVGSCLDFLLSLTSWKANVDLIDFDQVSLSNCNRSLAFSAYDAIKERQKVHACYDLFKSSNFSAKSFNDSYDAFIKEGRFLDTPPDAILCLANDRNIWYCIQNNLPPLVLHATTTPNWGLNFGRHIPKKEWCIMCRFGQEVNTGFVPPCSEGVISRDVQTAIPIQGVLPFLSSAAAILVIAELAKMNMDGYPVNRNFIQFSTKTPLVGFRQQQRIANHDCMCNGQPLEYYPGQIKATRFWKLTENNSPQQEQGASLGYKCESA